MTTTHSPPQFDVLIVDAGLSGIGAGSELLRRGNSAFLILEAAFDLGGTWRDNTYPGVAVDIASAWYCFSFETHYPWSNTFATQRPPGSSASCSSDISDIIDIRDAVPWPNVSSSSHDKSVKAR